MICTDKDKLAEIIASRVGKTCKECNIGDDWCDLFDKESVIEFCKNDRLIECKELFKEDVKNEY